MIEAQPFTTGTQSILIERVFPAAIDRVFAAWTTADLLNLWFGPEGFRVTESQINLAVGGDYKITIESPEGQTITHYGTYVAIDAPSQLSFTWILDNQDCVGSRDQCTNTLVSIELEALTEATTKVSLLHEQLPDQEACNGHSFGWRSSFESLAILLAQE